MNEFVIRGGFNRLVVETYKNKVAITEDDKNNQEKFKVWINELYQKAKSIPTDTIPKLDINVLKKWLAAYENKGGYNKTLNDLMNI